MSHIQLTTLDNGLRIITDTVTDSHSVALGIWCGVGTRHEDMADNGAAHMVEHMLFKGTKTRNAQQIVEVIENVGGSMNAYTSREITSYHVHLLKNDMELALDVLADMYQNSELSEKEVERERQVILQEIGMCNDTPDDLVFDNYYEAAYPGQAFGAPILGRAEIISNMQRDALAGHIQKFYTPARTVISAAGNIRHDEFVQLAAEKFSALPANNNQVDQAAKYQGTDYRQEKELEQSHFVLGFEGLSRVDDRYYTAQALATILGGGMSSRLFQEVREKRGLVYSIFAFHSGHSDTGQFAIYAGTGPDKLAEIIPVICDEILKATASLSDEEIGRAKAQLKANTLMGRESMMTRADQQAKYVLFRNKALDMDALISRIDAIDAATMKAVATEIFGSNPTLSALGPLSNLAPYEQIIARLAA